jgi:hypothetical protein
VVATNSPINDLLVIHTKQATYMTYVIGARVPSGSIERGLYWDTMDPYHFIRLQSVTKTTRGGGDPHDILIVGGEDHKSGQAESGEDRHLRLEEWARIPRNNAHCHCSIPKPASAKKHLSSLSISGSDPKSGECNLYCCIQEIDRRDNFFGDINDIDGSQ